jgi:hypothetical protein
MNKLHILTPYFVSFHLSLGLPIGLSLFGFPISPRVDKLFITYRETIKLFQIAK